MKRYFDTLPQIKKPKKVRLPKALSVGEETLAHQLKDHKIEAEREYHFAPPRKWRADFAINGLNGNKVLVEVEGGTWRKSRHNTGAGYEADCEKYNAAALHGFVVLRYTTGMVKRGEAINDITRLLDVKV